MIIMSCMGIIMKGFVKGFNKRIAHLFVLKQTEIEIEIGLPTDVKHVGHIGWDGPAGSSGNGAPSWMGNFETGPNFTATSIVCTPETPAEGVSTLTSTPEKSTETVEGSTTPKKRRKKHRKSKSSSSSTSTSSTRTGGSGSSGASSSSKKRRSKTRKSKGHAKET